ncbi:mitochondrial tRNA-specific 2-thiouridylase 1 isoform X2 [Ptiloglossa arizonensis]|uniref:mitochondrial tRNA-specific 2-thiouridylase 1 isoform X2 n=1 Tax=Ptiloglossa arizonensis TaxID=3350558 RepID=UPI003FA12F7C
MFKKVIVGISGGVDSAVAALMLKKKGFNVIGVFMKNWDIADETGKCVVQKDYEHAQWVCDKLKIPLIEVNFVKEYWNHVFSYMIEYYEKGNTPNPDILCNKYIKFDKFYHFARTELQADAIATGHYVKTSFGPYLENFKSNTNVRLFKAEDKKKDQTFFLSQIPQESLRYSMFPLGNYLKSNVKQIAQEAGLQLVANKKESMGICFVGKRNFQTFISEYISDKPGDFIDFVSGRVIGKHLGFHYWTIGQRTKLPSISNAYFVYKKQNSTNNILVVSGTNHPALYSNLVVTDTPFWISEKPEQLSSYTRLLTCDFCFQHIDSPIPCLIHQTLNNQLVIQISQPLRALTPGQFAVLYNGEECLGSAMILNLGPSYYSLNREVKIKDLQECDKNEGEIAHATM